MTTTLSPCTKWDVIGGALCPKQMVLFCFIVVVAGSPTLISLLINSVLVCASLYQRKIGNVLRPAISHERIVLVLPRKTL